MQQISVKAFYDDYDVVIVEVACSYYNGTSDHFSIQDKQGKIIHCMIQSSRKELDVVIYHCLIEEELHFGKEYDLISANGYRAPVQFRKIVQTERFEHEFSYPGNDLGSSVLGRNTFFNLWAPTATEVIVRLIYPFVIENFTMGRSDQGIWRLLLPRNLNGVCYQYLIKVNGQFNITVDPYGKSSNANSEASVVVDVKKLMTSSPQFVRLDKMTDAIVYELSVRDLTSAENSQATNRATFDGLCQPNLKWDGQSTGFDYIKSLGITHIQLLPVFDFYTVDENYPTHLYNWGYDPIQYMCLEGSYSQNAKDGLLRIKEFKNLVNQFHQAGIGVNMDVVFNHVYDVSLHAFEKCVPYYYFRYNQDGTLSNGSFCGNDLETRRSMVRKYILDTCMYFTIVFGIDGFRFDLMGILDTITMNQIVEKLQSINPSTMIYGEGWNMPTAMSDPEKCINANHNQITQVAFFNDYYRDHLKGKTSQFEKNSKGYLTGDAILIEAAKFCLAGNAHPDMYRLFDDPVQSINYLECHDNTTLWDKLKHCCNDETREIRILRQKLCNGILLLSQGVPFIHLGQEFCRTKEGYDNTYNMPDRINQIDWARKNNNIEVVEYVKDCIQLRKKYAEFRLSTGQQLQQHVFFTQLDEQVLVYNIKGVQTEEIQVFINPMLTDKIINSKGFTCVLDQQGTCNKTSDEMILKGVSMLVLIK